MKLLAKQYNPQNYNVVEETNPEQALRMRDSRSVTAWGNGPIPDSDYYQLAMCSPQRKGDKQLVIVCRKNLLKDRRL